MKKCKHERVYPTYRPSNIGSEFDICSYNNVHNIYEVYCADCKNFITLLTKKIIRDNRLVALKPDCDEI